MTRDIDQIVLDDCKPEETHKLKNQKPDEDKPGLGQNYCVPCARHFVTDSVLGLHKKTKEHKKRFKVLTKEMPYTHEESQKAAGMYVPQAKIDQLEAKVAFNQSSIIQQMLSEEKKEDDEVEDMVLE